MRRPGIRAVVALAGLLLVPLIPGPAHAVVADGHGAARGVRYGRYAIGDSVMLGAIVGLRARGFTVSARVSRQFSTGVALVDDLADSGRLPRKVIVHLGNNGTVLATECRRIVHSIGRQRQVWFVTVKVPRSWQRTNNHVLRACVRRYARAHLIPWNHRSGGHPSWFASDGYHLTGAGRSAYASFIDHNV